MPLTALFMGPQPEGQRTRAEREHAHTYCRECPNIFHIYNIIRYNAPGGTPSPAPACPVIKTGRATQFCGHIANANTNAQADHKHPMDGRKEQKMGIWSEEPGHR